MVLASISLLFLSHPLKGGRETPKAGFNRKAGKDPLRHFSNCLKRSPQQVGRNTRQQLRPSSETNHLPLRQPSRSSEDAQVSGATAQHHLAPPPAPFPPKAVSTAEHGGTRLQARFHQILSKRRAAFKDGLPLRSPVSLDSAGTTSPFLRSM